ncbi:MAG TPA: hypothetical protein VGP62_02065 [Bryobacteraceae bacterium]|nr:hypothetical protein [Bryobacteraceae bacterium]
MTNRLTGALNLVFAPEMSDKTRNAALLALMWIFVALSISTVLPFSASKTNDLGYYSLCSFAPWSSLALLFVAGVLWAIRKYLLTRVQ